MKRKSRILITLLTAAITFGTLFAIAGAKRSSYWQHKHCGYKSLQSDFTHQEKWQPAPIPNTNIK